jgi:hypothetical protein
MARIYWAPMGVGALRYLDVDFVTGATVEKDVRFGESETLAGGVERGVHGQWERVTIERETITPSTTAGALMLRELRTLESHLLAGFSIGVAVDPDLAYFSWLSSTPMQGALAVVAGAGNHYLSWAPTVTAATVGEEYVLHEVSEVRREERHRVTSIVDPLLPIIDENIAYQYSSGGSYVFRHRYFWPVLKLHADAVERGSILIDEGGARSFTLLLDLREDLVELVQGQLGGMAGPERRQQFIGQDLGFDVNQREFRF